MESHAIEPKFQLITASITITIILGLIVNFLRTFCSHDQMPVFTPKDKTEVAQNHYVNVETGLNVEDFNKFDILENNFILSGVIWFKYNKDEIDIKTIEKFDFKNGTLVEKIGPYFAYDEKDKKEIAYFDIKIQFSSDIFFYLFPFEDHKLYLMLVTNENVIYNSAERNLSFQDKKMNLSGWLLEGKKVIEGHDRIDFNNNTNPISKTRSAIVYEFDFFLKGIRLLITILLPLLIIFFIEMFSMCLDRKDFKTTLISLSTSNIGALVAYRFVINNITPKVGYLTLGDYLFFLFLTLVFANFIISNFGPYFNSINKKIVSLGFQSVVVLAFIFLLNVFSGC